MTNVYRLVAVCVMALLCVYAHIQGVEQLLESIKAVWRENANEVKAHNEALTNALIEHLERNSASLRKEIEAHTARIRKITEDAGNECSQHGDNTSKFDAMLADDQSERLVREEERQRASNVTSATFARLEAAAATNTKLLDRVLNTAKRVLIAFKNLEKIFIDPETEWGLKVLVYLMILRFAAPLVVLGAGVTLDRMIEYRYDFVSHICLFLLYNAYAATDQRVLNKDGSIPDRDTRILWGHMLLILGLMVREFRLLYLKNLEKAPKETCAALVREMIANPDAFLKRLLWATLVYYALVNIVFLGVRYCVVRPISALRARVPVSLLPLLNFFPTHMEVPVEAIIPDPCTFANITCALGAVPHHNFLMRSQMSMA